MVKAHRAASGGKGGRKIRRSVLAVAAGPRNPRDCRQQGPSAELHRTGGQVHDSQVVEEVLDTPEPPLAVSADKAYDSEVCGSRSRMKGRCLLSPVAATPPRKPIAPSASTDGGTRSRTTSAASRIGGESPPVTTNSPEISLPPQPSSAHSIGSSCESRPSSRCSKVDFGDLASLYRAILKALSYDMPIEEEEEVPSQEIMNSRCRGAFHLLLSPHCR